LASLSIDISGEGSAALDSAGYVDHVTIHLTDLGLLPSTYGAVAPLKVFRAGWWAFGATFQEDDAVDRFYCGRIMWIDFVDQVFNGEPLNRYWDSVRWNLATGVAAHIFVASGGPG
jgi:hypothetical protein